LTAYWDAALTQVVTQPVRTRGGYPLNGSAIGRLYVNSNYSIKVRNRNGFDLYSSLTATERYGGIINASDVVYDPAGTGAVATTVQTKLRESVSVKDFGAVGDGVTDDTAAIQAAATSLTNGGILFFPPGTYKITTAITMQDKTEVHGSGIGATLIQSTAANTSGAFLSSAGNLNSNVVSRTYFGCFNLSIDLGHTLDTTSTSAAFSGGKWRFLQWDYNAGCIRVGNTDVVIVENVQLKNGGTGIDCGSNANIYIKNADIQGMQWDGIQSVQNAKMLTIDSVNIENAGRNGIISYKDKVLVSIENFKIQGCRAEGIEIEERYDASATKKAVVTNGWIFNCGTFIQFESYNYATYASANNVYMDTPTVQTSFGNRTFGYADVFYNLASLGNSGVTPTFPVPNEPGTWGNLAGSGVKSEGITGTFIDCVFKNMSTTAIASATAPIYAAAIYESVQGQNIVFDSCTFISSNAYINNGENRKFVNCTFTNSALKITQPSGSFLNYPSTIIANSIFAGAGSGIELSDNAIVTSNSFYDITGIAINISGVPADGRTEINGNSIMDTRATKLMTGAIYCTFQNPPNCDIRNNNIFGATTYGIYLFGVGSTGYEVVANRIEGCDIGILMDRCTADVVMNNVMRTNTTCDINLYGAAAAAAGTALRIVCNILQSTTAILASAYTTLPGTSKFVNNEFTTLNPANTWTATGTNTVQGNWS